jgi:hypothetical protein
MADIGNRRSNPQFPRGWREAEGLRMKEGKEKLYGSRIKKGSFYFSFDFPSRMVPLKISSLWDSSTSPGIPFTAVFFCLGKLFP